MHDRIRPNIHVYNEVCEMICPICDSHIPDDSKVCSHCGEPVVTSVAERKTAAGASKNKNKPARSKKDFNKRLKAVKTGGLFLVILAVIVAVICFIVGRIPGKGIQAFESISEKLGRSVEIAQNNAGVVLQKDSEYPVLHEIINYDYIYTADKTTKVGGIFLPEWAVYIQTAVSKINPAETGDPVQKNTSEPISTENTSAETTASNVVKGSDEDLNDLLDNENRKEDDLPSREVIETVTYYDFKVLNKNWKGQKTSGPIDIDQITYGMTKKKAEKLIKIAPLFIRHSSNDITTYCYKYYYVDNVTKNEKALYLEINYSADNTVKSVNSRQNDYISFLFK